MAIQYTTDKSTAAAKSKVAISALFGLLIFVGTGAIGSWYMAPILAWDGAALLYIVWIWSQLWPMSGKITAQHAVREDPSRATADTIVLIASIASLLAVGIVLAKAGTLHGNDKLVQVLLAVISVVVAWWVVHTIFVLRYAELYYHDKPGGVDFPKTPEPSYQDFAYLAFTVGMTFQVSDTGFQTTAFRRAALQHSLTSYLFGTVIVATTINLIAGLTS